MSEKIQYSQNKILVGIVSYFFVFVLSILLILYMNNGEVLFGQANAYQGRLITLWIIFSILSAISFTLGRFSEEKIIILKIVVGILFVFAVLGIYSIIMLVLEAQDTFEGFLIGLIITLPFQLPIVYQLVMSFMKTD